MQSTASCPSIPSPASLTAPEWAHVEAGVIQRVTALNLLLDDLYHRPEILRDGVLPTELILGNANYRSAMQGLDLPHRTYVTVCGIDLVRDDNGEFLVLEDNARTPSGVSYVVENRHLMLRAFPDLLEGIGLRAGGRLRACTCSPRCGNWLRRTGDPQVVLLSPGTYNSAYFEHVFLAREMGMHARRRPRPLRRERPGVHAHHRRACSRWM